MKCWINGPTTGGIDDKIKMTSILLKTNIAMKNLTLVCESYVVQQHLNYPIKLTLGFRDHGRKHKWTHSWPVTIVI